LSPDLSPKADFKIGVAKKLLLFGSQTFENFGDEQDRTKLLIDMIEIKQMYVNELE